MLFLELIRRVLALIIRISNNDVTILAHDLKLRLWLRIC